MRKRRTVVIGACIAMLLVLLVWAHASRDPVRIAYNWLLDNYRMTTVDDLADWFNEQQAQFLPIAIPGEDPWLQTGQPTVVPFDPSNFPKKFTKRLIGEWYGDAPGYDIVIIEDPDTRETVFFDDTSKEIYALKPPKGYDPEWFVLLKYPDLYSGSYSTQEIAQLVAQYDPARIQISVRLVPTDHLADYLEYMQSQIPPDSGGGGILMSFTTNDFSFTDVYPTTNGTYMEFTAETGAYYKVQCADYLTNGMTWKSTNMLLGVAGSLDWTDTSEITHTRFYRVWKADRDAPGDEDNDALDDLTELEGVTDPLDPDTDDDTALDGYDPQPTNSAVSRLYLNITTPADGTVLGGYE